MPASHGTGAALAYPLPNSHSAPACFLGRWNRPNFAQKACNSADSGDGSILFGAVATWVDQTGRIRRGKIMLKWRMKQGS
jgi:hypothetical protein